MSTPVTAANIQIRKATPADAEVLGRICYEAFLTINRSHNYPPEIPSPEVGVGILKALTSQPEFYCVAAEIDGRLVGSNCLDERSPIAGVGPITIDPSAQNQGVGRLLMEAVLQRAAERNFAGVRLMQGAFHARSLSLYTKLGFDVREPLAVMQGQPLGLTIRGYEVTPLSESDVAAANRLCEQVHGHHRAGELLGSVREGRARKVEHDGRLVGYSSAFGYWGHSVAESNMALKALIGAAEEITGLGLLVPTRNSELFRWLLANGFRVILPATLMTMGLYNEPKGAFMPSVLY
jgi:GNAT superfamily N-acetyltransferase